MKVLALDHGMSFENRLSNWTTHDSRAARIVLIEALARSVDRVLLPAGLNYRVFETALGRSSPALPVVGLPDVYLDADPTIPESGFESLEARQFCEEVWIKIEFHFSAETGSLALERFFSKVRDMQSDGFAILEPIIDDENYGSYAWRASLDLIHLMGARTVAKIRPPRSALIRGLGAMTLGHLPRGWLMASTGFEFDEFLGLLTVGVQEGCLGYAAGSAIWGDLLVESTDEVSLRNLVKETGLDRIRALNDLL